MSKISPRKNDIPQLVKEAAEVFRPGKDFDSKEVRDILWDKGFDIQVQLVARELRAIDGIEVDSSRCQTRVSFRWAC